MPLPRVPYRVDVVIPCYNEEEALPRTLPRILSYFTELTKSPLNQMRSFRLLLVDDGSRDSTWRIIEAHSWRNAQVVGIKLSRNYGHQSAMLAGLTASDADAVITMDADLQDDIHAVASMLEVFESGIDMALGVRSDRSSDAVQKRTTANAYYRLLSWLGVDIIENHADFRLMSRRSLDALLQHEEVNLFLRGLIPQIGFSYRLVPYVRQAREHGETKYTVSKMVRLAIDGVTSFSAWPLRMISILGFFVFVTALSLAAYFLWQTIFRPGTVIAGWASTVIPLLALGGLQLLSVGVLGEYVSKIYMETKRRPRFLVEHMSQRQAVSSEERVVNGPAYLANDL